MIWPTIIKMGCKENLNWKTRCLPLVFVLFAGHRRQAPVMFPMMLLLLPKMDLGLFSELYW